MANEEIGKVVCPVCEQPAASMRRSGKSGKPYVVCTECGSQSFARGQKAVEKMLGRITPTTAAAAPVQKDTPKGKGFFDVFD